MNYKKKCHGTEANHNDGHLKYIGNKRIPERRKYLLYPFMRLH